MLSVGDVYGGWRHGEREAYEHRLVRSTSNEHKIMDHKVVQSLTAHVALNSETKQQKNR